MKRHGRGSKEKIRYFMKTRKITWGDKISKTKTLKLPVSEIISMRKAGASYKTIAKKFKVSVMVIYRRCQGAECD